MKPHAFVVLLLTTNLFITHVNSFEVFVDAQNGNDSNSVPGPFKTLQKALITNANSIWMKSNAVHDMSNATISVYSINSLRIFSNGTSKAELRCLSSTQASFFFSQINSLTIDNLIFGNCTTAYGGLSFGQIKNLVISNSVIESFDVPAGAAALSITKSNVTIAGITIRDNTGYSAGGGIYVEISNVTITDSTITCNSAGADGGGLYYGFSSSAPPNPFSLNIVNSTFTSNFASGSGGAMYLSGSGMNLNIRMSGVTIDSNTGGTGVGGGLCMIDVAAIVENSWISSNYLSNTVGGGVFAQYYVNSNQIYKFINTEIFLNHGDGGAGLRFDANPDMLPSSPSIIQDCWIHDNVANNYGAGISLYYYPLKIFNTEITGNYAPTEGGGIHLDSSLLDLYRVNITQNSYYGITCYNSTISIQDPSIYSNTPSDNNGCQDCIWLNSTNYDCSPNCQRDICSVCNGDSSCLGCNDVPFAGECPSPSVSPHSSTSGSSEEDPSKDDSTSNTPIIAGVVGGAGGLIVLVSVVGAFAVIRKRRSNQYREEELQPRKDSSTYQNTTTEASTPYGVALAKSRSQSDAQGSQETVYGSIAEEMKIPEKSAMRSIAFVDIKEENELGRGSFGVVFKGTYKGQVVAVKKLLDSLNKSQLSTFASEADIMASIPKHKHVVELIGVVSKPPCIVAKYYANGSLQQLLRNSNSTISKQMTIQFIRGITEGMAHLAQHKVVHRDLAARNILLDQNWEAIVSDFGFARALQEDTDSGQTYTTVGPIRWMALESLTSRAYSEKSDVWSWAVTVWECLTRGVPFSNLDNVNVIMAVTTGQRLSVPTRCSPKLASLMTSCWDSDPNKRPTFEYILEVVTTLGDKLIVE